MSSRLKDVAALAGVSVRTVSNVVSGSGHVAEATRQRVQQALDELGYRPNLAARNLRAGRTGLIGLVVPELYSPYFGELASLIVEALDPSPEDEVLEIITATVAQARKALEELEDLVESGFGRNVSDLMQNLIRELHELEHQADDPS